MKVTRRLIEESQGKSVRLADIAKEAGVSRQAIYLHFGSRVGVIVSAVQYVDEAAGFAERTSHIRQESDSVRALELFVDFWAEYLPSIYGLARQLLTLRQTDEAAAAAWHDRMSGLRDICGFLVERLHADRCLDARWHVEEAADFLWMLISVQAWESLVIERGWSSEQYRTHLKHVAKRILTTTGG